MELYRTIVSFFQQGGVFMYPIVLVLALGSTGASTSSTPGVARHGWAHAGPGRVVAG